MQWNSIPESKLVFINRFLPVIQWNMVRVHMSEKCYLTVFGFVVLCLICNIKIQSDRKITDLTTVALALTTGVSFSKEWEPLHLLICYILWKNPAQWFIKYYLSNSSGGWSRRIASSRSTDCCTKPITEHGFPRQNEHCYFPCSLSTESRAEWDCKHAIIL